MTDPAAQSCFNEEFLLDVLSGNLNAARNIVETFISQSDQLLKAVEEPDGRRELDTLVSCFHRLAGSSHSIGAMQFGEQCKAIEIRLKNIESGGSNGGPYLETATIHDLKNAYQRLRSELNAFLESVEKS